MILADRFKRLLKLRFAIVYPLGIYLAVFAYPSNHSIVFGGVFILLGVLTRIWSNGYAIKMGKLTTSGPYQFVRNPLYVGTTFIMLGFVIMLKVYLIGAVFFLVMALVYRRTIKSEEQMLADKFGEAYLEYMRYVPGLVPSLFPYRKGEKWAFSWQRLWESREHKVLIWVTVTIIAFHLKEKILILKESLGMGRIFLIVIAVVLILLDVTGEIIRGLVHRETMEKSRGR